MCTFLFYVLIVASVCNVVSRIEDLTRKEMLDSFMNGR